MSWKDFMAGAAEHMAGHMADTYGRYSRDSRLSDEQREKAADAAERCRDFRDRIHDSRRDW